MKGVRCTHRDFAAGRCTFGYDATGEGSFDGNGHGTHVASISGIYSLFCFFFFFCFDFFIFH
jgi:hypothetical protein